MFHLTQTRQDDIGSGLFKQCSISPNSKYYITNNLSLPFVAFHVESTMDGKISIFIVVCMDAQEF